jgi:hypothetical protein
MRSWVFRHRQRLRVIYGVAPAASAPSAAKPRATESRARGLDPGEWRRTSRHVVLRPMRRRSA